MHYTGLELWGDDQQEFSCKFNLFVEKRKTGKAYGEFHLFRPQRSYSIYRVENIIIEYSVTLF